MINAYNRYLLLMFIFGALDLLRKIKANKASTRTTAKMSRDVKVVNIFFKLDATLKLSSFSR